MGKRGKEDWGRGGEGCYGGGGGPGALMSGLVWGTAGVDGRVEGRCVGRLGSLILWLDT